MKTPTWNDVENARDLHTGPQRDIPQPEAKHIAGPWRITNHLEQGGACGRRITVDGPGCIIADCDWNTPAINLANAELIRSAPDLLKQNAALLAALKALLEYADAISSPGDNVEKKQARAAIRQCEEGKLP